ncbi:MULTISPECIES: SRPBCC domain-containing protein [Chryseobacterium]|uniref:SRPBCC domain-containing protein n=1 Tax=Candidatus Chryseobacterium massiliense TaxID=204089 RepID=A0A3D9B4B6_9FLAO|nr:MULTISPECIES: SRPBCC domain-containing protein [Chryseobacterium]REC48423.1 SRPBCC domain-containing protein [Candidatus Chryseobacterium massiliae]
MEKLHFDIQINAEAEKVWSVLWDDFSFRQWTSAFTEGSFYQGNLKENEIIKFLDPQNNGMFSKIVALIPNQEIKFLHLGEIYNGVEAPQNWGEATERYILTEDENTTHLKVEIQTLEQFKSFFEEKFPDALSNVKHLSENQL